MNVEEFNTRIAELTVGTDPLRRKELLIRVDDGCGTCFHLKPACGTWVLMASVGRCKVSIGCGSQIKLGPSWRRDDMMELTIGLKIKDEIRDEIRDVVVIRGYVFIPEDAGIEIEVEEESE